MDKKILQERLNQLIKLKENHLQDVEELGFVIDGLKEKIENTEE